MPQRYETAVVTRPARIAGELEKVCHHHTVVTRISPGELNLVTTHRRTRWTE